MQVRLKLAVIAVAGAASLALTAAPAVASGHSHPSAAGREVAYGQLWGRRALTESAKLHFRIPVRLHGVVRTRGVRVGESTASEPRTVRTRAGWLAGRSGDISRRSHEDKATCRTRYRGISKFVVLGGLSSGAFAGASGRGWETFRTAFSYPRLPSGKCDFDGERSVRGAMISYRLVIPRLRVNAH